MSVPLLVLKHIFTPKETILYVQRVGVLNFLLIFLLIYALYLGGVKMILVFIGKKWVRNIISRKKETDTDTPNK